jgi:hypothetical protein
MKPCKFPLLISSLRLIYTALSLLSSIPRTWLVLRIALPWASHNLFLICSKFLRTWVLGLLREQISSSMWPFLSILGNYLTLSSALIPNFFQYKNIAYRFMSPDRLNQAIELKVTCSPCIWTRIFLLYVCNLYNGLFSDLSDS